MNFDKLLSPVIVPFIKIKSTNSMSKATTTFERLTSNRADSNSYFVPTHQLHSLQGEGNKKTPKSYGTEDLSRITFADGTQRTSESVTIEQLDPVAILYINRKTGMVKSVIPI